MSETYKTAATLAAGSFSPSPLAAAGEDFAIAPSQDWRKSGRTNALPTRVRAERVDE